MSADLFSALPTKGEQARQRLLEAALEKIGERGYESASVREIADAAGQNVAAISYYFGSKEKLYQEVIEGIVRYFRGAFGAVADEARAALEAGDLDCAEATAFLKRMLRVLLVEHIERKEIIKIRNVMIREQAAPTEVFTILYERSIRPLHELCTGLTAVASGEDPESPVAIIRSHAIFGQVLAFTVARSTIFRRLGIEFYEPAHAEVIGRVIDEHVDLICAGLGGKGGAR